MSLEVEQLPEARESLTKIVLVDDHTLLLHALRSLMRGLSEIQVVGECNDSREVVEMCRQLRPDVVVMDVSMPNVDGVAATQMLAKELPEVKVLGLSMHVDLTRVCRMLAAGAKGYVTKDCVGQELANAIRAVSAGRIYLCDAIMPDLIEDYLTLKSAPGAALHPKLTERERQVVELLAKGNSTREVAQILGLGVKTVETHRTQAMRRLRMKTLADLTRFAVREGLASLES